MSKENGRLAEKSKMYKKSLLILAIISIVGCTACYSPKYTYRVLVWQESDYDDARKFKFVEINNGRDVFSFKEATKDQSEKELLRLASFVENEDFKEFLQERGTYSFIVIRNDSILVENYFKQNKKESLQNTFSISKSILSLAIAKAIELGYIKNVDESITTYIAELLARDKNFEKITIGDLLRMKSGIKYSSKTNFPWLNRDSPLTYYHPNLRKVAIKKTKIEKAPNTEFLYNNYNPLLLGLILERATNMKLSAFIEEHFWEKIGAEFGAKWSTDEKGFEKMESGFMATPIDLAKIGRLILNDGKYKNQQIIDKNLLREFTTTVSKMKVFEEREWGYGHLWWTLPDETSKPSVMANGHMGQFIFVNPKTNYIIVRNGLKKGKFYDDDWTEIFKKYTQY